MTRRIVLFVVEGPTDADLLLPVFNAMLTRHDVCDEEFHCDMLTAPNHRTEFYRRNGFYPSETNPLDTVRRLVVDYLDHWEYSPKYLECVLQVCDLDGAFIPDDHVRANPALPDITYLSDAIVTPSPDALISDHRLKQGSASVLVSSDCLKLKRNQRVPYRLFYCSRNLEHAFCGLDGTLSDRDKRIHAARIAARYANDPQAFRQLLADLATMHGDPGDWERDWERSWRYALEGLHSLQRGSNLAFAEPFILQAASR